MKLETVTIKSKAKSGITIINADEFDAKTMKKATAVKKSEKAAE